jgi:hypothetical protein
MECYLVDLYKISSVQLLLMLQEMLLIFPTRKTSEPPSNEVFYRPRLHVLGRLFLI